MVRNMSPENSNPKPEGARLLSRQERIDRLRDEQQQRRIIEQRDAVSRVLKKGGYGCSIVLFVDPNDNVLSIENRYGGPVSGDWRVVRCESSEVEEDQPRAEIQTISSVKKLSTEDLLSGQLASRLLIRSILKTVGLLIFFGCLNLKPNLNLNLNLKPNLNLNLNLKPNLENS